MPCTLLSYGYYRSRSKLNISTRSYPDADALLFFTYTIL